MPDKLDLYHDATPRDTRQASRKLPAQKRVQLCDCCAPGEGQGKPA